MRSNCLHRQGWLNAGLGVCCLLLCFVSYGQPLVVNDSGYFEKPGVNVMVFSSQYNGMFFDEKTAGIELIHHGVRTCTGGAVRLQNTPEQVGSDTGAGQQEGGQTKREYRGGAEIYGV
ncbi:hypothetical protein ACQ86N_27980 [Puia sp. P3]|uniref:hypothetical protein n=1 Tax=Puia sp. P3 TaxID=3423952 RepID=UPI003D669345